MAIGVVLAFWAVSALFVITPGADWAYAISAGIGHRSVVPAVSGLLLGHFAATIAVAAGVAAVVAASPAVLTAITILGAAYLLWLGIGLAAHPPAPQALTEQVEESWARRAVRGAGISGLNPKVILLFLALLPQFTDPLSSWPIAAQIATLGLVHIASCAAVYLVVATGARTVLRARPAAARAVSRASGVAMVILGLVLLTEQAVQLLL